MKKINSWLVLVVLLITMFGSVATVSCAEEEVKAHGLDIIILYDVTISMEVTDVQYTRVTKEERAEKNDPKRQRADAAVMLINMCDNNSSKVAIIPYGSSADTSTPWCKWVDVTNENSRTALCNAVLKRGTQDDFTNPRDAITKANELIESKNDDNNVVVIILTDGETTLGANTNAGAITEQNELSISIAEEIRAQGVDIYGVFMNKYGNSNAMSFLEKVTGDSNKVYSCTAAADLITRFSDIFADQIGTQKKPGIFTKVGEFYSTTIDIPNGSVEEANIVLPFKIQEDSDVEVKYNGESVKNNKYIIYSNNGNDARVSYDFVSVKLLQPEAGNWDISAKPSNADASLNGQIQSADVLYNYNIALAGSTDKTTYHLNEEMSIKAFFVDGKGIESKDTSLYTHTENNGKYTIGAEYTIFKDGSAVYSDKMTNTTEGYTAIIDLDEFRKNANPYGTYEIHFSTVSDELERAASIEFAIENRNPEANSKVISEMLFVIDDPFDDSHETAKEIVITDYFFDEDDDELIVRVDKGTESFSLKLDPSTKMLTVKPLDATDGKQTFSIYAKDSDPESAEQERSVSINVVSVQDILASGGVTCKLSLEKGSMQVKGGTAKLKLSLEVDGRYSEYIDKDKLCANAVIKLTVKNCKTTSLIDFHKETMSASYTYQNTEADYVFEATVFVDNNEICSCTLDSSVSNNAPAYKGDGEPTQDVKIQLDEVTDFAFNCEELFYDSDTDIADGDKLTYSQTVETIPESLGWKIPAAFVMEKLGIKKSNDTLIETEHVDGSEDANIAYNLNATGKCKVTVIATDNDGETAEFTYNLTITSAKENTVVILVSALLSVIALIIILVLVYILLVRTVWPNRENSYYEIYENENLLANEVGDVYGHIGFHGKGKHSAYDLWKTFRDSSDHDEAIASTLKKISIYPVWGRAFVVKLNSKRPDTSMKVGQKTSKKLKLGVNNTLEVSLNDSEREETVVVGIKRLPKKPVE